MKKMRCVLASLLLICLSNSLVAQVDAGLVGGLNFADLNLENETSSRAYWGLGGVIDIDLFDNFSIRSEPMYIKKGGVIEADDDSPRITVKEGMLELPIFARYEIGNLEKFYFLAGPSIAYVLSNEIDADINGLVFNSDITDNTNRIDIGLGIGAGLQFPISIVNVFLEGRYTFGLNNLQKGGTYKFKSGRFEFEDELDVKDNEYKSRGLRLFVGITLPL